MWDRKPNAGATPAGDAYVGTPFKVNREYARVIGDAWVILSAKYGFLWPSDPIPGPYNVTFKRKSTRPVEVTTLSAHIADMGLARFDQVVGLGGKEYRSILAEAFAGAGKEVEFPFAGLTLGLGLQAIKRAIQMSGR